MNRLTNHTDQPIRPGTGHDVPANGHLDVTDDVRTMLEGLPYIAREIRSGRLTVERREVPPEKRVTRASVARANRKELVEILEAHGCDPADLAGRKVEDDGAVPGLRTLAARAVFVDA